MTDIAAATFFRKAGKIGAATRDVWAVIIFRRLNCSPEEATRRVELMITEGELQPAEE